MKRTTSTVLSILVFTALAACGNQSSGFGSVEETQARLEQENGGYSLDVEAPAFGQAPAFEAAGLLEAQVEIDDVIALRPEVQTLISGVPGGTPGTSVGGRRFVLVAVWGQPRLDWDVPTWTDWSGEIAVDRGAVVARRAIRFDAEDALPPRTDPRVLPFASYTQPHHDGLVLGLYDDPAADPALPGAVTLRFGALQPVVIPFDQLPGFRLRVVTDDLGNQLFLAAEEIPREACGAGFLMGRWHRLRGGMGYFIGQWSGAQGELHGHLAGIYGRRRSGEQVLFGKYIGQQGEARGVLVGAYEAGRFAGRWVGASGPEGVFGGVYHETLAGPETGGFFLGGWARTHCQPEAPSDPSPEVQP